MAPVPGVVASFAGTWQISGSYGEHFTLILSQTGNDVSGVYYADRPTTYPRGEIEAALPHGAELLTHYRYHAKANETDSGEILLTVAPSGELKALWTDGEVTPSETSAGGSWTGHR